MSPILSFARHFVPILSIFIIATVIRFPFILNSDHFLTADVGVMANTILDLINGGPIVFYYDYSRYFGLTGGLVSVPFMWVLGINTMAFNLPGVLFYSLYLWTLYLIARIIVPSMALLILILMLVTPPYVTEITALNWPHISSAFLGNLIFLFFIKVKMYEENRGGNVFLLFFVMGLAIYTYTFSLIYISVVVLLFALSHPKWNEFRQIFCLETLKRIFKSQETKKKVFVRFLDMLIVLFLFAIVFSYIFGGFGIDIAGISIFQINNLYKPVIQLLVILFLRILVYREDLMSFCGRVKSFYSEKITRVERTLAWLSGVGFLLGLSPRIASILIGETSRGGQGFDVDFNPIKLIAHIGDIFVRTLPSLFSLVNSFQGLTFAGSVEGATALLVIPLLLLLIASAVSFCFDNLDSVKKIFTLRMVKFNPDNIFILMPVLILLANTLVQNGSQPRYLFPLFGTSVLWIGIFTRKFQDKIKGLSLIVLAVWSGFYSMANYKAYNDKNLLNGFKVQKFEKLEIYNLIEFLESKQIKVAYSDYWVSQVGSFLSKGNINISEYSNNPVAKKQKRKSLRSSEFAIIAWEKDAIIFQKFLLKNNIAFEFHEVAGYKVYWRFSGDQNYINKLRSLISGK